MEQIKKLCSEKQYVGRNKSLKKDTMDVMEIDTDKKMRCGHKVFEYILKKIDGVAYIQWICTEGCSTTWGCVGEVPRGDELEISD